MKEKIGEKIRNEFESLLPRASGTVLEEMVQKNVDRVSGFVRFINGMIYVFPKRYISKSFIYAVKDVTEYNGSKEDFLKNKFFESNMRGLNALDEILSKKTWAYKCNPSANGCNLVYLVTDDQFNKIISNKYELTVFDKILFQRELEVQKIIFRKKLETYWKRYGCSFLKVKSFYERPSL